MNKYGYWDDHLFLEQIEKQLKQGAVIAGTSDTVPGLLAPLTPAGKAQLDAIKVRAEKPYLILVDSLDKAAHFSESFSNPMVQKLTKRYWPGPLTIIVPLKKNIPSFIGAPDRTVAIRIPDHPAILALLKNFEGLFSTSANLSGMPIPISVAAIDPAITKQAALIVDDRHPAQRPPSTIVAYRDGALTVVRQGAVTL